MRLRQHRANGHLRVRGPLVRVLMLQLCALVFCYAIAPHVLLSTSIGFQQGLTLSNALFISLNSTIIYIMLGVMHYCPPVSSEAHLSALRSLVATLGGTPLLALFVVLFGAPIDELHDETIGLAFCLAGFTVVPMITVNGLRAEECFKLLVSDPRKLGMMEQLVAWPCVGALLGAWFGAIPIPLDWDRPWQAFPKTIVWGAQLGYGSGLVLAIVSIARSAELTSNKAS